jgi:putative toxin-antitoxin system antitoxin component (TIGR02293 family)
MKKHKEYKDIEIEPSILNEPLIDTGYTISEPINNYYSTELSYNNFKKILDLNVFTIAEWAALLQISERTMHRYAKENLSFNGILTERINLLHTLIKEGIALFGTQFKAWLNTTPYSLFGKKPIEILYTQIGILEVFKIMKRMQHGIVA